MPDYVTAAVHYVQNEGTGAVHRALMLDGVRFTAEQCNVDQIEAKKELGRDEAAEENKIGHGCGHCWPVA